MSYNTEIIERAEPRHTFDEATPRPAPVALQMQELEMQVDRIGKIVAILSEHINLILTPDHPRESKSQIEVDDRAETSIMARSLQKQVMQLSQIARRIEELNSRIEF